MRTIRPNPQAEGSVECQLSFLSQLPVPKFGGLMRHFKQVELAGVGVFGRATHSHFGQGLRNV